MMLSGCGHPGNAVTVRNMSSFPVADVRVEAGGRTTQAGIDITIGADKQCMMRQQSPLPLHARRTQGDAACGTDQVLTKR